MIPEEQQQQDQREREPSRGLDELVPPSREQLAKQISPAELAALGLDGALEYMDRWLNRLQRPVLEMLPKVLAHFEGKALGGLEATQETLSRIMELSRRLDAPPKCWCCSQPASSLYATNNAPKGKEELVVIRVQHYTPSSDGAGRPVKSTHGGATTLPRMEFAEPAVYQEDEPATNKAREALVTPIVDVQSVCDALSLSAEELMARPLIRVREAAVLVNLKPGTLAKRISRKQQGAGGGCYLFSLRELAQGASGGTDLGTVQSVCDALSLSAAELIAKPLIRVPEAAALVNLKPGTLARRVWVSRKDQQAGGGHYLFSLRELAQMA